MSTPSLQCSGCGAEVPGEAADPFRCPNAGTADGCDHVLVPDPPPNSARFSVPDERQPFLRHRELLWTYRLARSRGLSDVEWTNMVGDLDRAVAAVDGRGLVTSPCAPAVKLAAALGLVPASVWIKDETENVAGSHKSRHLFGLAMALEVRERTGLADASERSVRELAIASCGNAALAAAVIARAAGRPLRAFIPEDANPCVVARLSDLGARVEVCRRVQGASGDPCILAFRVACERGAVPFCVQGSENGLTIEGGETLAWEMVESFAGVGQMPDRLFVQTGGGALASACVSGLRLAVAWGVLPRMPRIHVVQTAGSLPLRRAWERVAARVLEGSEDRATTLPDPEGDPAGHGDIRSLEVDRERSAALGDPDRTRQVHDALRYAREHRARFMWPWELSPHSIAHGILDDETYDWAAVVDGTIESRGWPLTVSEGLLAEARSMAREATGIRVDATGAAGLAGLIELSRAGAIGPGEQIAILLTGVERG